VKVFADTFYWIALTDSTDAAHKRARQVTDDLVTTDEVLTEYLNFFSASQEFMRREIVLTVEDILQDPDVTLFRRVEKLSLPVLASFVPAPTRATASPIAFRCAPCNGWASPPFSPTTGISSRKVSGRSSARFRALSLAVN
jgi:hypothetical protein